LINGAAHPLSGVLGMLALSLFSLSKGTFILVGVVVHVVDIFVDACKW
jgi:hypothetical protein